jgi:hypothetical protein
MTLKNDETPGVEGETPEVGDLEGAIKAHEVKDNEDK